jgi:hypothetical protein
MTNDGLEQLFMRAKHAGAQGSSSLPSGFADRVYSLHVCAQQKARITARTSVLSISAALVIFAAVVGWNFNSLLMAATEEPDPVDEMAQSLWVSAGN